MHRLGGRSRGAYKRRARCAHVAVCWRWSVVRGCSGASGRPSGARAECRRCAAGALARISGACARLNRNLALVICGGSARVARILRIGGARAALREGAWRAGPAIQRVPT